MDFGPKSAKGKPLWGLKIQCISLPYTHKPIKSAGKGLEKLIQTIPNFIKLFPWANVWVQSCRWICGNVVWFTMPNWEVTPWLLLQQQCFAKLVQNFKMSVGSHELLNAVTWQLETIAAEQALTFSNNYKHVCSAIQLISTFLMNWQQNIWWVSGGCWWHLHL